MKINPSFIVRDHLGTLHKAGSTRLDTWDMVTFYGVPIACAIGAFAKGFAVTNDSYNVSITFFGIFLALLLNIQVAIFSIFQRKWDVPTDKRLAEIQRKTMAARRELLGELNANISYLTFVSCIGLAAVLIFYVEKWLTGVAPAVAVFLYAHFLLTFVMIVKRSHALFQKEYRDSPE
ncbi:hypothetical protein [Sphingomonas echinoides]|uniref:Uncharacterized protein n=1 Tax=Sphingomonas echinoides TaxID=59803 RepID=A0ABU4PS75_9SPHN|nr:hypothetical protein [Sphingomonas echinoides]MDX5986052.1 hypothetical protein [Sphingomonas echinoides]